MTALLVEAGAAAWLEDDPFAAHEWWEHAWLQTTAGPQKEALRGLIQWAAAAHLDTLGRNAAAQNVRDRALGRLERTQNRLTLAQWLLDIPDRQRDVLTFRPQTAQLPANAVILAAGQGTRAGGPKGLIDVEGQPLWLHRALGLRRQGIAHVRAVVHPQGELLERPGITALHSDPLGTPLHSLQKALKTEETLPIFLLPVDCPLPPRGVLVRLLAHAQVHPEVLAVRPLVEIEGQLRGGHPVLLTPAASRLLLGLDAGTTRLDRALHALGPAYAGVQVRERGVLGNFNRDGRTE